MFYTPKRQVNVMLDIWPNLPIRISACGYNELWHGVNNLIAALEHTDRICQVQLYREACDLESILSAMQKPFPALTNLTIDCSDYAYMEVIMALPQAFLGSSAQHLQSCHLSAVDFPGIWKLLLTANHLITLCLWHIPHSMYASPEGIATFLSTMPNLESLSIGFWSPESLHDQPDQPNRPLSPPERVVLPSLMTFHF